MTHSRVSLHTQPANDKKLLPNTKGLPLAERKKARFGNFTKYPSTPLWKAFVVVALLFLAGCSKKEADTTIPPSLQSVSIDDLTKYLANASGIGEEKVIYNADSKIFTLDGDMVISREEAEKYFRLNQGARTEHWRSQFIVADQYAINIKVYIDPTVPVAWVSATRSALFNLNTTTSKLRFSEVSSGSSADITIGTTYTQAPWVAQAYLPSSNQRPGNLITINTYYNSLTSNVKEFTMIHELGHTIGFYHTDQTQGIFIAGTPTTDANSFMNSFVLPWNGFTPGDIIAINKLYPGKEDQYLVGDWDGDGRDNIAVRRGNQILMDTNFDGTADIVQDFGNGNTEDQYLVGDWNGDGRDNIAVRRGSQILMDTNFDGRGDTGQSFGNGNTEDQYLVGDWDGDGRDNVAVRRGSQILMDTNFDGAGDIGQSFGNGSSEDQYLVGDWDGDRRDNVAVRRGNQNQILMDTNFDGAGDTGQSFGNGNTEDQYLVGDWNGDRRDNIAVRRGNQILMDTNFDGVADRVQIYGFGI